MKLNYYLGMNPMPHQECYATKRRPIEVLMKNKKCFVLLTFLALPELPILLAFSMPNTLRVSISLRFSAFVNHWLLRHLIHTRVLHAVSWNSRFRSYPLHSSDSNIHLLFSCGHLLYKSIWYDLITRERWAFHVKTTKENKHKSNKIPPSVLPPYNATIPTTKNPQKSWNAPPHSKNEKSRLLATLMEDKFLGLSFQINTTKWIIMWIAQRTKTECRLGCGKVKKKRVSNKQNKINLSEM